MKFLKNITKRATAEPGQALVELSVGLGLLAIIMMGVMEFGQIAYSSIEVSSAAKAGVEYASQNTSTASDTTGITTAAQTAAPHLSGLSVVPSHTCVCSDGSSSTCANTDCATPLHLEETATVSVSYSLTPIIRLPGLARTFSISRSASQKCAE